VETWKHQLKAEQAAVKCTLPMFSTPSLGSSPEIANCLGSIPSQKPNQSLLSFEIKKYEPIKTVWMMARPERVIVYSRPEWTMSFSLAPAIGPGGSGNFVDFIFTYL
jgi:hypothetical protein